MWSIVLGGAIMILFGLGVILWDKWTSRKEQGKVK